MMFNFIPQNSTVPVWIQQQQYFWNSLNDTQKLMFFLPIILFVAAAILFLINRRPVADES